ncbi:hypothetical protein IG631_14901 [Alternaria alternata]|jgi:hypothetical protein|nr:hypothetical protein IG631_14901 [Alternaria alternata]
MVIQIGDRQPADQGFSEVQGTHPAPRREADAVSERFGPVALEAMRQVCSRP